MADAAGVRGRRAAIERLLGSGTARVDELAELLGVSPSTIRRDLQLLGREERVVRTYGGAVPSPSRAEKTLLERALLASDAKQAIGRHAASLVTEGQVVILDAGTTVGALAAELAALAAAQLTVVTNGLSTARLLEHCEGIELVLLGGTVRALSSGTVGPVAERAIAGITADVAFLSADGVVAGRGLSEATDQQAALKRLMIDAAADVVVLADASKLGERGSHWWAALDRPWRLVTDAAATDEQLGPFRDLGVEVHVAPAGVSR